MVATEVSLFDWRDVEPGSDLDRFYLARAHLPDAQLAQNLEVMRGSGRAKYPVAATWNAVLARRVPASVDCGADSRARAQSGVAASVRLRGVADPIKAAGAAG